MWCLRANCEKKLLSLSPAPRGNGTRPRSRRRGPGGARRWRRPLLPRPSTAWRFAFCRRQGQGSKTAALRLLLSARGLWDNTKQETRKESAASRKKEWRFLSRRALNAEALLQESDGCTSWIFPPSRAPRSLPASIAGYSPRASLAAYAPGACPLRTHPHEPRSPPP